MIDVTTDTELSEWQDLIKAPGFQRLLTIAREEFGDLGYGRLMKAAVMDAKAKGEDVQTAVEKVDYASDAVNRIMSRPKERVQQLLAEREPKGLFASRRRA